MEHRQIEVAGRIYGYWMMNGEIAYGRIRSETNPKKQPSLKEGSKAYAKIRGEIEKKEGL